MKLDIKTHFKGLVQKIYGDHIINEVFWTKFLSFIEKNTLHFFFGAYLKNSKKWNQTFIDFLDKESFKLIQSSKYLGRFIDNFYEEIQNINNNALQAWTKMIDILWDVHPYNSTKILVLDSEWNKKILYNGHLNSEKYIFDTLIDFDPQLKKFFPDIDIDKKINFRSYHEVENNLNLSELKQFYYNFWYIAPYMYLLRAIDITYDNIICQKTNPLFIDCETLFTPKLIFEDNNLYTIKQTWIIWWDFDFINNSAIFGWYYKSRSLFYPKISWFDTHEPEIKRLNYVSNRSKTIPLLEWMNIHPRDYLDEIMSWYQDSSNFIIENKNKLKDSFRGKSFYNRLVVNLSSYYEWLMRLMWYGELLWYDPIDMIKKHLISTNTLIDIEKTSDLIEDQLDRMKRGIIPLYYSDLHTKFVLNSHWKKVATLYKTPYESFTDHLVDMNTKLSENKEILRSEIERFNYTDISKQFRADYVQ